VAGLALQSIPTVRYRHAVGPNAAGAGRPGGGAGTYALKNAPPLLPVARPPGRAPAPLRAPPWGATRTGPGGAARSPRLVGAPLPAPTAGTGPVGRAAAALPDAGAAEPGGVAARDDGRLRRAVCADRLAADPDLRAHARLHRLPGALLRRAAARLALADAAPG